jgi:DNA invertase Pin-like site-specific DNA recombinase
MIDKVVLNEIKKIQDSDFAKKTDKQLMSYEILSELHKGKNMGIQPIAFKIFNDNRTRKLSIEKILEIKRKYNPYVYGKLRLAKEYGVSKTLIHKILKNNIQ